MSQTEILLTIKLHQQLFVDPKRIMLLKAIQQYGSISQAAKQTKISYKSAWDHLEAMNMVSLKPLLERNIGGKNGGGTQLTRYAMRLIQLYDLLEKLQEKAYHALQDEQIPLDSLLNATSKFALQSSARNQFFGKIIQIEPKTIYCDVKISIDHFPHDLTAFITQSSCKKLQLTVGKEVMLMIKAPWLKLHQTQPNQKNCFQAQIIEIKQQEEMMEITLQAGNSLCFATIPCEDKLPMHKTVWVSIDPEQIILLSLFTLCLFIAD